MGSTFPRGKSAQHWSSLAQLFLLNFGIQFLPKCSPWRIPPLQQDSVLHNASQLSMLHRPQPQHEVHIGPAYSQCLQLSKKLALWSFFVAPLVSSHLFHSHWAILVWNALSYLVNYIIFIRKYGLPKGLAKTIYVLFRHSFETKYHSPIISKYFQLSKYENLGFFIEDHFPFVFLFIESIPVKINTAKSDPWCMLGVCEFSNAW